jgi:folate-dependent phosphoribosylglycinamide formyltransferase PurN
LSKLGWFSTGRDRAARELLQTVWHSINKGEMKAEISFVFSNREFGESTESDLFFELVRSYGLPLICLSSGKLKGEMNDKANWRQMYDKGVMQLLESYHPDLCVLAGYMLIVGEEMCTKYNMLNLHPAAPGGPAGTWQEVIWRLIEERAEESGVMMHLVTPELDKGPPVTYCTFPIRGESFDRYWQEIEGIPIAELKAKQGGNNPLFKQIRKQGLAREFPLIVATLKAFGEGRLKIEDKRMVSTGGEVGGGYNLTREINDELHLLRP